LNFKVESDHFRGPVDLLLYLVRRHEVEVTNIALAGVTHEYLEYIDILKEISIDQVGDFIEVASILVELKARAVLPRNELEQEDDDEATMDDPRQDLVRRLLMFKQFKDASNLLEEQRVNWQKHYSRMADDLPSKKVDPADQPIKEVELWDLVSAFGRVLRDNRPVPQANILYDETPIHVYMQRIHAKIVRQKSVSFSELFEAGMHKSSMVGIFLAVLELTRYHNVVAQQNELHSEILIVPNDGFSDDLDVSNIDEYNPHLPTGDPGSMVD
jgi:segregation and condensation protein A